MILNNHTKSIFKLKMLFPLFQKANMLIYIRKSIFRLPNILPTTRSASRSVNCRASMDSVALRTRAVATLVIICQAAMVPDLCANLPVVRVASTASVAHLKLARVTRAIVLPILRTYASPSARLIASMVTAPRQTNASANPVIKLPKIIRVSASPFAIRIARTVSACSPTCAPAIRAIVYRRIRTCAILFVTRPAKQTVSARRRISAFARTVIA